MSIQEEYIKIQTCVLRVNIHCEGCRRNVKKLLKKIEGVYIVSIDPGHGKVKVTVTMGAEMSPEVLAKKLNRRGKISEMLVPQPVSGRSLIPVANNGGAGAGGWACQWDVPAPAPKPLVGGGSSSGLPTPGPQVLSVKPSPAPSKKSEQVQVQVQAVAEDEWEDDDEEDEDVDEEDEDVDEEDDDEEEEEEEGEKEEEVVPAQNNVNAPAHATAVTKSGGGSRVPSKVGTPNVNVGIGGAGNVASGVAHSNFSKPPSTKSSAGGNSSTQIIGGGGEDLSEAMRAMTAGRGVTMGGGGQNMGQQVAGGQFQSPYGLPPRPNNAGGPFIINPNPYQQQQPQQLAPAMNMNYQPPRPAGADGMYQQMAFGQPYQNMPPHFPAHQYHQYAAANQAAPAQTRSGGDDFLYAFNDENTQSCSTM